MDWVAISRETILIDIAGGLLFAAVGLVMLARAPPTRVARAFAVFAIAYGVFVLLDNLVGGLHVVDPAWHFVTGAAGLVAGAAILVVAVHFPAPVSDRRVWLAGGALATAAAAGYVGGIFAPTSAPFAALHLGMLAVFSARFAFLGVLAARYRSAAAEHRPAIALASVALGLEQAFRMSVAFAQLPATPEFGVRVFEMGRIAAFLGLCALWLANTMRTRDEVRRRARIVTVTLLLVATAGLVFVVLTDRDVASDLGPMGLARIAGVLILGYGVVQGQIPGMDVRVRWAISKTTIGAVFIAVFFVVSGIAQRYFESSLGPYMGIAAAGALVFALAPLQRLADNLANRAVPMTTFAVPVGAAVERVESTKAEAYRAAVRMAWADGVVSADDDRALAHLADELGLTSREATRIRHEEDQPRSASRSDNP